MEFSFMRIVRAIKNDQGVTQQELDIEFNSIFSQFREFFKEINQREWNAGITAFLTRQKCKQRARNNNSKFEQSVSVECFSKYLNSENFKCDKPGIIANLEKYICKANAKVFVTNHSILEMLNPEELGFSRIGFSTDKVNGFIKLIQNMVYSCDNYKQHEAIMYMMIASLYAVDYDLDEFKEMLHEKAIPFFSHLEWEFPQYFSMVYDFQRLTDLLRIVAKTQIQQVEIRAGRFIPAALWKGSNRSIELPTLQCSLSNRISNVTLCELVKTCPKDNIMVIGCGGSGKTYTLISLVKDLTGIADFNAIPLYIPLHDFTKEGHGIEDYIIDLITKKSDFNSTDCRQLFWKWLENEHDVYILLLLDGFNEIISTDIQGALACEIGKLVSYNNIKMVITSRYDMSNSFAFGMNTVATNFFPYKVDELTPDIVLDYIDKFFKEKGKENEFIKTIQNEAVLPKSKDVKPILRTPMGLIMYCFMKQSSDIDVNVPYCKCNTMGELVANYLYCIKSCYAEVEDEYCDFLEYLGYRMSEDGLFKFSNRQLFMYGTEFFGDDAKTKLKQFRHDSFVKDVVRFNIVNGEQLADIEYVHQNYRDFFAASYLKKVITTDFLSDNINACFGNAFISIEVLTLLSDILGEYNCVNGGNSYIQDTIKIEGLLPVAVAQLINIAKIGRKNDLSAFDFSGLDLTSTSLNKIKLYRNSAYKANFENTKVTKCTFNALGHEGAVYALLCVKEHYIVSFSKNGIFCFDMIQRRQYQIAEYPAIAIHSAYHDEKTSTIYTGDTEGNCVLWKYKVNKDIMSMVKVSNGYYSFDSADYDQKAETGESWMLKSNSEICDLIKFENKIFAGIFDGIICSFIQSENKIADCKEEWKIIDKGICRLSAGKKALFASCGKTVCRLVRSDKSYDGNNWKCSTYVFCNNIQIKDIAIVNFGKQEYLLINAANTQNMLDVNKEFPVRSSVFVVPVSAFDNMCKFDSVMKYVYTKPHSSTRQGFKGWKSFSEPFENVIYLTANIEDDTQSAGLLRISMENVHTDEYRDGQEIIASDLYGNRHSMEVNCAVAFKHNMKKYIVTGSTERSVELLCTEGGDATLLYHLDGHDNGIHSIDIINDKKIITAHYSGEVCVWIKWQDCWKCIHANNLHTGWVWQTRQVEHNKKNYIISCSYDNTISIISEDTEELICRIIEPTGRVLTFGIIESDLIVTGYINDGKNVLQKFRINYEDKSYIAGAMIAESDGQSFDELRYITSVKKDSLLLCFNNNKFGVVKTLSISENTELDVIRFSSSSKVSLSKKINLRCADEVNFKNCSVRAVGGDAHNTQFGISSYLNISLYDQNYEILSSVNNEYYSNGCSAVKLLVCNDELYLIFGSYDCSINICHIYFADGSIDCKVIAKRIFSSKVLDIQYKDHLLYISTLDGYVSACDLSSILCDDDAICDYLKHGYYKDSEKYYSNLEILFQSVSGFEYCHLDLTKVNAMDWDDNFRGKIGYYAEVEQ